ncbi:fumarylacetoacetase [Acidobacteria bacterium AB60]|nr:fumarylacetoacetase [Acidobacteria bacterium AB60]
MALKSWVESANQTGTDFPLANLPYGVFRHGHSDRIGVAIGDQIFDLRMCASDGLLAGLASNIVDACTASILNPLMSLGPDAWSALRARITSLLSAERASTEEQRRARAMLVPQDEAEMRMPAQVGDYTDFYASLHHATRVGKLFRPDNPLLPNYKYVPIGYHGRASSLVTSGTEIRRPRGQTKPAQSSEPTFGISRSLDYELEIGIFIGAGNALGQPIPMEQAERHIFGFCLVNDWSARDIQSWEYQPLGPFLAKSFATTLSPWIVPLAALDPYHVPVAARAPEDPKPLPYLAPGSAPAAFDLDLEVFLESAQMRASGKSPLLMSRGNLRDLYWSPAQLLTHHASNGCNLRPGDLLATGTISGPGEGSEGCLLEMQHRANPVRLPTGETRRFLEDGDRVTFRAFAEREGLPRLGFGECTGTVLPAG